MGVLWDVIMKDETFFNINPQYAEFSVIHHPYPRLPSSEISPAFFSDGLVHI